MTGVTLQNVSKNFGKTKALENIDWEIRDGEFMVLVGPSGCGKTTMLKIILGALEPSSGHVYLNRKLIDDVPIAKRNIGFVPQDFGLFPHLTVYDNIAYGLRIRKHSSDKIRLHVRQMITMLQLDGLDDRKPRQLSWGQQQRVALARALAIEEACNCPSGRLVEFDKKTGKAIEKEFTKSLSLVEDPQKKVSGPIWVKGGVPVESSDGTQYELRNRQTLCRCGKSENKPFCDGTHREVGFNDCDESLK